MATSGITANELSRDQIITRALRKLSVIGEGQTASAVQLQEGADALNPIVHEFNAMGMPLWKRVELPITLQQNVSTYTIGVGQTINQPYPVKIVEATLQQGASGSQIDVEIKASYDFNLLPTTSSGTVVTLKYQPLINSGVVTVWPTPNTSDQILTLTYYRPLEVFNAAGDTSDFPQEWQNALIYTLALSLADEYGIPLPDKQWLEKKAEKHISNALAVNVEEGSLMFYPDRGD